MCVCYSTYALPFTSLVYLRWDLHFHTTRQPFELPLLSSQSLIFTHLKYF